MIRIIDYGVGNVQAFLNVFKRLGLSAERADSPRLLEKSSYLILPGVGHFDHAMRHLNASGMRPKLEELVLKQKVPILGVCVGMQMLGEGSDEGTLSGLDWVPGRTRAFSENEKCNNLPMPHMGWNELKITKGAQLFSVGFMTYLNFIFYIHFTLTRLTSLMLLPLRAMALILMLQCLRGISTEFNVTQKKAMAQANNFLKIL